MQIHAPTPLPLFRVSMRKKGVRRRVGGGSTREFPKWNAKEGRLGCQRTKAAILSSPECISIIPDLSSLLDSNHASQKLRPIQGNVPSVPEFRPSPNFGYHRIRGFQGASCGGVR